MTDLEFLDRYAAGWSLNCQPHLVEGGSVSDSYATEGADGPEMDLRLSKGWARGEALDDALAANSLCIGMVSVWNPAQFHQVFGTSSGAVIARMVELVREDRADRERVWNEAQADA